ncbi:MAG: penicillin-binding protein 1A [Brevinemataceae bacterium]
MSLKSWQIKLFILLGLAALITGFGLTKLIITFNDLQDVEKLDAYAHYSVPSKLYDIKGRLITEFYREKRDLVSFHELPQNLIRAIIATEDNQFYQHKGANFGAMLQGTIIDPLRGRSVRGGSGLTQQLAKLLYTDSERSIKRKLIELWYAFQIEKKYSKEEILELYFNLIYFGHGQYGIQAASKFYFNKPVQEMSLAEASFLAGLPQAPSGYSPINNYQKAQARHKVVLKSMCKNGYISPQTADETFQEFWTNYDTSFIAATQNIRDTGNLAPFFSEYIRQQILKKYGEELLYSGGLQIYTTLDLDMQKVANDTVENMLANEQSIYSQHYFSNSKKLKTNYSSIIDLAGLAFGIDSFSAFSDIQTLNLVKNMITAEQDLMSLAGYMFGLDSLIKETENLNKAEMIANKKEDNVEGALVSINPKNGYIQAMVGGRNYSVANQFNRATQAQRQMGSSVKPLIFALALDNKIITPSEIFVDEIISYKLPNGSVWTPRNYNGSYLGAMTVRKALRLSVNIITIKIWERMIKQIGYQRIIESLGKFLGEKNINALSKRFPNQLATTLGTGTASPLKVAQAYSAFINNGKTANPIGILSVYDRYGKLIDDFKTEHTANPQEQVISAGSAKIMQSLLNDVVVRGTAAGAASRTGYREQSKTAGKSGTSSNWTDTWFAGFTDQSVTVIWVGLDAPGRSLGKGRSSSSVVAGPWMSYMKKINSLYPPNALPYQINKNDLNMAFVSPYTGLLTPASDPEGYIELFLPGTAPQTYADPKEIARIQAQLTQQNNYEVTGSAISLSNLVLSEEDLPIIEEDPFILENPEDLDLSFDQGY